MQVTERGLDEVVFDLTQLQQEYLDLVSEESEIQEEISKLREKLTKIRGRRVNLRQKRIHLEKEKESSERKIELAKQQAQIEKEAELMRQEAQQIIADAPWREVVFDWQIDGAIKLAAAGRGLLADVRGMGKTLSAIAWRRLVKSKKTLVLTRKAYAEEFIKELHYREPGLSIIPLVGASTEQRKVMTQMLKEHENFVVVANFEMWRRSTDSAVADLLNVEFDAIILDEAHRIKTVNSVTTQGFLKLAESSSKLLEMTGTPIQNRPQELFAILHAIDPVLFPSAKNFIFDYCYQIDQNKWIFRPGGLETLVNRMSKFFIARTPEDVGHKIPPPHIIEYTLDFTGYPRQAEAYKVMTERSIALLRDRALPVINQLAVMTRQAQMVSWPAGIIFTDDLTGERIQFDVHESVKVDWAEDLNKELTEEGHRTVLFSRFKPVIYELKQRLESYGLSVAVITGDEDHSAFKHIGNDFDLKTAPEKPKYQVLLGTYETIGESLNLNAARHAIQFDRYWKPAADDQAIGRIDRINSIDRATIHRPRVENTIDDFMVELIEEKLEMLNGFKTASDMQDRLRANLERSL